MSFKGQYLTHNSSSSFLYHELLMKREYTLANQRYIVNYESTAYANHGFYGNNISVNFNIVNVMLSDADLRQSFSSV
ncbi:hypothetical protein HOLleu_16727 [Holothuria leucospilota]|uniref:Uncharacterized protein n=1 Tax=Holothuria leucospilota TaxID=206669 RepID=A0A9Q1C4G8_HOLLE|nr:hypothetical protein HOLleu_16727 [Holothuria leucospilota]